MDSADAERHSRGSEAGGAREADFIAWIRFFAARKNAENGTEREAKLGKLDGLGRV